MKILGIKSLELKAHFLACQFILQLPSTVITAIVGTQILLILQLLGLAILSYMNYNNNFNSPDVVSHTVILALQESKASLGCIVRPFFRNKAVSIYMWENQLEVKWNAWITQLVKLGLRTFLFKCDWCLWCGSDLMWQEAAIGLCDHSCCFKELWDWFL